MCLVIDEKATKKAKKRRSGFVHRWKKMSLAPEGYLESYHFTFRWKPGVNKAKGKLEVIERERIDRTKFREVGRGVIHVFKKKPTVCYRTRNVLVRVKCYLKEIFAVGRGFEAYKQVVLEEKEFLKTGAKSVPVRRKRTNRKN